MMVERNMCISSLKTLGLIDKSTRRIVRIRCKRLLNYWDEMDETLRAQKFSSCSPFNLCNDQCGICTIVSLRTPIWTRSFPEERLTAPDAASVK